MDDFELGIDTFGDVTLDAQGQPKPAAQVIRDVIEEAELADRVGLDFIGLGEHHREDYGRPALPIGVHSPGYVADNDDQARDEMWPHFREMHARIGRERGWPPMTRDQFDASAGPDGAVFVGSPETVADKIVRTARTLGLSRFDMKYSAGPLPHEHLMTCIELYGTKVAPMVREQLAAQPAPSA